ncbi:MAG: hypothetical protein WBD28_00505, partial [Candidatus Zixiibacteriota bacterium]
HILYSKYFIMATTIIHLSFYYSDIASRLGALCEFAKGIKIAVHHYRLTIALCLTNQSQT